MDDEKALFDAAVKWFIDQGFRVEDGVLYDGDQPRCDLRSLAVCLAHPELMKD